MAKALLELLRKSFIILPNWSIKIQFSQLCMLHLTLGMSYAKGLQVNNRLFRSKCHSHSPTCHTRNTTTKLNPTNKIGLFFRKVRRNWVLNNKGSISNNYSCWPIIKIVTLSREFFTITLVSVAFELSWFINMLWE